MEPVAGPVSGCFPAAGNGRADGLSGRPAPRVPRPDRRETPADGQAGFATGPASPVNLVFCIHQRQSAVTPIWMIVGIHAYLGIRVRQKSVRLAILQRSSEICHEDHT